MLAYHFFNASYSFFNAYNYIIQVLIISIND